MSHENLFLGANVETWLVENEIPSAKVTSLKSDCLNFYVTLALNIRTRFDFDNAILKFMANFDPKIAMSGTVPHILPVMGIFKDLDIDPEIVNTEWRLLAETSSLASLEKTKIEDFWYSVGQLKDNDGNFFF